MTQQQTAPGFDPTGFDYGPLAVNTSDVARIGVFRPVSPGVVVKIADVLTDPNSVYGEGAGRAYAEEIVARFNLQPALALRVAELERAMAAHETAIKKLSVPAQSEYRAAFNDANGQALAKNLVRYNW